MEVVFELGSYSVRYEFFQGDLYFYKLVKFVKDFDNKFFEVFDIDKKGYNVAEIDFVKVVLSNMIGSIGYFYGFLFVKLKYNKELIYYWFVFLYLVVFFRFFFSRGFFWDEGFYNFLISQWDFEILKDIIVYWLDLFNIEGWIFRE